MEFHNFKGLFLGILLDVFPEMVGFHLPGPGRNMNHICEDKLEVIEFSSAEKWAGKIRPRHKNFPTKSRILTQYIDFLQGINFLL